MAWFVYLARCRDGSLYCGITNDLEARFAAHNAGKGAKYTRRRGPVELVYRRKVQSRSRALELEYRIKQLTRAAKLALIS
jgi:putative endonuclease